MRRGIVVLCLCLATLVVFLPVSGFDFLPYDDPDYVTANPFVRAGVTPGGLARAFSSPMAANWHPLTWLSHMIDVQLFGLAPGAHHLVNLVMHTVNAALLFIVLVSYSGVVWPSAFVAALFALHPLHVESVAWVAERKDVLSVLFALLTLGGYLCWVRQPTRLRYAGVGLLFAAGLMSKPMLVTLPFVLLLLDWWPLGRMAADGPLAISGRHPAGRLAGLVLEKLPLLALTAAAAAVTLMAQRQAGAIRAGETVPFAVRLAQVPVSYARYLLKTVWPADLVVFYPHPAAAPPWWQLALATAALAGITALAVRARRTLPFIAVGWLWFLGTLVPVIGLVQVGHQLIADRYTYLPLIGLFVAAAWGATQASNRRGLLAATAAALLITMIILSRTQLGFWRNGESLFTHAIARTRDNWLAHNMLGAIFLRERRLPEAIDNLREAVRIKPTHHIAHYNLANALAALGQFAAAAPHYEKALLLDPPYPGVYRHYGDALMQLGKIERAAALYRTALDLDPASPDNHRNLGVAYQRLGRGMEALQEFQEASRLHPEGNDNASDRRPRR